MMPFLDLLTGCKPQELCLVKPAVLMVFDPFNTGAWCGKVGTLYVLG